MNISDAVDLAKNAQKEKGVLALAGVRAAAVLFPPLCMSCSSETTVTGGLCPECWVETHFITGAACDACGQPLFGQKDDRVWCDACIQAPQAWDRGAAAVTYDGNGRRISLGFKHGDRLDMAGPMADWMIGAGVDLPVPDLIVPVPLHWSRMIKRRYNQAAVLGNLIAQKMGVAAVPDLLTRHKRTLQQKGMSRIDRFENQQNAIRVTPRFTQKIEGQSILLVDDVMTTGATLSACAETCLNAGADRVNVLVFARVARDD